MFDPLNERYGFASSELSAIDPDDLIEFAEKYAAMSSVTRQTLQMLLDRGPEAQVRVGTVELIRQEIGGMNDVIDETLDEWLAVNG